MQSKEKDGLIFVRLFPGEDIHRELQRVCNKHRVETAVVLSGIGQLKQFRLGYYRAKGDYAPAEFEDAHELLSLTGNVTKQEGEYIFHLHAVLGDEDKYAIGGHLIAGIVEVTNELVLLKADLKAKRILEAATGLKGMFLEGENGGVP